LKPANQRILAFTLAQRNFNSHILPTPLYYKELWVGKTRPISSILFYLVLFGLGGEAVPAIYRLIAARLKGYFRLFAALSAGGGIHLARASIVIAAALISETLGPAD
jgi:hypothetical protein